MTGQRLKNMEMAFLKRGLQNVFGVNSKRQVSKMFKAIVASLQ